MTDMFDLAWAAGCIDGEGCIAIHTVPNGRTTLTQYRGYVSVSNTDPRMIRKFVELFGGSLIVKRPQRGKGKPLYEWRLFHQKAAHALQQVRPWLVVKGEQADIYLAFAATLKPIAKGTRQHPANLREEREKMRTKIAVLKREEIV